MLSCDIKKWAFQVEKSTWPISEHSKAELLIFICKYRFFFVKILILEIIEHIDKLGYFYNLNVLKLYV